MRDFGGAFPVGLGPHVGQNFDSSGHRVVAENAFFWVDITLRDAWRIVKPAHTDRDGVAASTIAASTGRVTE